METSKTYILARRKEILQNKGNSHRSDVARQAKLRKLIRANINDIYFFGRKCSREEIGRYVWR